MVIIVILSSLVEEIVPGVSESRISMQILPFYEATENVYHIRKRKETRKQRMSD